MFFRRNNHRFLIVLLVVFQTYAPASEILQVAESHARQHEPVGTGLSPGELDLLTRIRPESEEYNGFLWSPVFRGGGGVIDPNNAGSTWYSGGYLRPFDGRADYGDLVIGGLAVESPEGTSQEFQGAYEFPAGFGFGGGLVRRDSGRDVNFGKIGFYPAQGEWQILLEALLTDFGDGPRGGGYAGAYSDNYFAVAGYDGEQYRLTGAFISSESGSPIRPALEVIWVDASIGDIPGTRGLLLDGSLGYMESFLSNASRLGRAMGPTGVQFSNPNGFLEPTWNRRYELWEIGHLANVRYQWTEEMSGHISQRFEIAVFLLQLLGHENPLDGLFLGPTYADDLLDSGTGLVWGYSRKLGMSVVSLGVRNWLTTGDSSATLGVRLLY